MEAGPRSLMNLILLRKILLFFFIIKHIMTAGVDVDVSTCILVKISDFTTSF